MLLLIGVLAFSCMYHVFAVSPVPRNCTSKPCPGQCSVGVDTQGCQTCDCGPSPNCTSQKHCPGQCAVGVDLNGCQTCACPNDVQVEHKNCPDVICPGQCSIGISKGCQTCTCPEGVKVVPRGQEKCDKKTPCQGANKECSELGSCFCASGYTLVASTKTCIQMPQLGEKCLIDENAVFCGGYGVQPDCSLTKGTNFGKCMCKKGFELDATGKACQPIEKVLKEACSHDRECVIAYSICQDKKCTCLPGFTANKAGLCEIEKVCPGLSKSTVKAGDDCEVYYDSHTSQELHTCKATEYCYTYPKTRTPQGRLAGHCCPRGADGPLNLVCPLNTVSNGTCPDTSDLIADAPAPPEKIATCPFTTHDCHRQPNRKEEVCCPLPCRATSSHFAVNGLCFDYVLMGEPCKYTAQCIGGSECNKSSGSKQATCQCKSGFKQASATSCVPK